MRESTPQPDGFTDSADSADVPPVDPRPADDQDLGDEDSGDALEHSEEPITIEEIEALPDIVLVAAGETQGDR